MKEPSRMRETDQLPVALRDAFGALGRDAPSAETVLRVQRALEALPAVTPAAAAVATIGMSKLLMVLTLIAGASTSAMMLKGRVGTPHTVEPTSATSFAPAPKPVVLSPAIREDPRDQVSAPAEAPTDDHASVVMAAPDLRAAPAAGKAARSAQRAKARSVAAAKTPSADLSAQWARSLVPSQPSSAPRAGAERGTASGEEVAQPSERATSDEGESAASASARVPSEPSSAVPSLAAVQAGEAQKLAQCKRLAAHAPEEALRQVEALTREAPHGVFVQERELLEIRLHERLGHRAIAAELTQRFLERHPSSVYRRALSP